jgi:hypothetical protein
MQKQNTNLKNVGRARLIMLADVRTQQTVLALVGRSLGPECCRNMTCEEEVRAGFYGLQALMP